MKWFLDTEFYERGDSGSGSIDLISIGMVSTTGLELYAENSRFDWDAVDPNHWLQANVRPHLPGPAMTPEDIRDNILAIVGNKPEFYGWYCDYDWVVFCWLFGRMIDLPDHFPMFCRDLKQMVTERHIDAATLPEQTGTEHNALEDARWNLVLYRHLQELEAKAHAA